MNDYLVAKTAKTLRMGHMKKIFFIFSLITLPAFSASMNGFEPSYWGFIKASSMYSTEGLASFNNVNHSAPTHAVGHVSGRSQDKMSRLSFQTQQSRIGLGLKKGENLSGKLEFDFIDFNKSSPTTQMNPRVRIASITYKFDDHNKIIVGQDWDLFSPVGSFTFDIVGLYFMAGNTGFMRQQFQYIHDTDNWELGAAVGIAGNNPGVIDNDLELGKSPTYSARISRKLNKGRVGVSAIYSRLHYTVNDSTHDAYAGNAFYEQAINDRLDLKSEIYYGQNLNNIGSLGIGKGTATSNVKEYGGTLTANQKLTEKSIIFGGVGLAKADNRREVTPLTFGGTVAANVIAQPGVTSNFLSRIGYNYLISEDFSWINEVSRYDTRSRVAINHYQNNVAYGLETGFQLRF